jgi:Ca-activated chloride channel family protein
VRHEGDGRPDGRDAAREPQVAILVQPSRDEWITSGRGRISRFGFDVPSSSIALVRDALLDGRMPEPSAVRVEEFVNAVSGGEPPPESETFAIGLEAARSPFDPARSFLRVGIRAREVPRGDRKPVRLVFVVDLSESMGAEERLGLLKRNLRRLVERLDGGDSIGIVTYGTAARVVLAPTPGDVREGILEAIEGLQPEGSTDAGAALRIGYGLAAGAFEFGALNRVVLCTDDTFDGRPLGEAGGLLQQVRGRASAGIELAVLGLGGRGDDALQRLAREGRGPYASVGGDAEARRFLLRDLSELSGVVARDARVEVALDPARVQAYRLLGSQTTSDAPSRGLRLAAEDAGAVHGGQTVTTLYELRVSPGEGPLGTVRVRFAHPETRDSDEVSRAIRDVAPDRAFDDASARFQLTVLAGRFAEHLRGDRPDEPFRLLHETAQRARPRVSSLDRETEILPMIRAAGRLLGVPE